MKLELDGASKEDAGFTSIGLGLTIECDWKQVARSVAKINLPEDGVDEVFSSHFLQRYSPFRGILNEICRVCRIGARVEMHLPHWLNTMAHAEGQLYTFSEQQVDHLTKEFIHNGQWSGTKRLALMKTERIPSASFKEAQGIFPHLLDDQILRFIPGTCHEVRFLFSVIEHK